MKRTRAKTFADDLFLGFDVEKLKSRYLALADMNDSTKAKQRFTAGVTV
jgi:hypothetical protein